MTPPTDKLAEAKKPECPCTHHRLVHERLPNHQYGPCRQCPCAEFGRNKAIPSTIPKVGTQEIWNEADFREEFKQMWNNDEKLHDFQNAMVYAIKGVMEKQALLSYEKGRAETIQKVENEFNVFMCSTNRCAHKERGEWKLFQDAKKQIIRRLKANHPTTDAK